MNGMSALITETPQGCLLLSPCKDTEEKPAVKQDVGSHLHPFCQSLHLGLPASAAVRSKPPLFIRPPVSDILLEQPNGLR